MNILSKSLEFLVVIAFIVIVTGCNKDLACSDGVISLHLIKYTSQEIDTLILTQSEPGNSQQIINTRTLIKDQNMVHIVKGDTISIQESLEFISQSFDWQITIPSVNRIIKITSIEGERRTERVGTFTTDAFCQNRLFSCVVDGIKITFPERNSGKNEIYITK